jgi:glycosyltransferase 2 family protein
MKRILLTVFQLAVTTGMLWWVFHDPNQRAKMAIALGMADYRWVGAGVLAYLVVEIAAAVRWQILLKVQKIRLSFPRLSGLFFIGMFYNQFLPGGTGGDIIKSYLLLKETDKKAGALLAVVFDRLIGLVALVTITCTLVLPRYDRFSQIPETRRLLWILLVLLGSSIAGLLTSFVISGFNLFHWLPHKFPGREKLIEISAAYHLYARHWFASLLAFGVSLVAHLATFTTFLCVAYGFKNSIPAQVLSLHPYIFSRAGVLDFLAVLPIERTITALPISFAGVGLREQILQVMLSNICEIPVEVAKLIGTMSFLIIFVCSAPGGIVYFFYKPSGEVRHVRLREMEREVATLEHEISEKE